MQRAIAAAIVAFAIAAATAIARGRLGFGQGARCGRGFVSTGARCMVAGVVPIARPHSSPSSSSQASDTPCPAPLVRTPAGCDAPDLTAFIPAASVAVGPSDWEAQGRVLFRSVRVQAFRIDAFEVTRGRLSREGPTSSEAMKGPVRSARDPTGPTADAARAASGISRDEAAAFCTSVGGRLPTEDEWIVAAASAMNPPPRYPWGDTGAVCRRAAWGLEGTCAQGADGPDTVGAHPSGDSPLGLHDLAGNVAEWVSDDAPEASSANANADAVASAIAKMGVVKGGSWRDTQASELRIWARREVPAGARDPSVGFRCVYPP